MDDPRTDTEARPQPLVEPPELVQLRQALHDGDPGSSTSVYGCELFAERLRDGLVRLTISSALPRQRQTTFEVLAERFFGHEFAVEMSQGTRSSFIGRLER